VYKIFISIKIVECKLKEKGLCFMSEASSGMDFPVTWQEIDRDTRALAMRLRAVRPSWKGLVAVTRGGMVPAALLARELDIKLIDTLCISSYEYKDQGEAIILKKPDNLGDGEGWLIADDLVDTGKTFRIAREIYPAAHYACVYAKPMGAKTADTFVTEVSQDTWIHFPWEGTFKS
jgi:xanthine phosphoribosyltransferase